MARVNKGSQFYLLPTRFSTSRMNHTCLYSQAQSITALWLVLISCPTQGRRLNWPGEILRWFARPKATSHGGQQSKSWASNCKSNALTTTLLLLYLSLLLGPDLRVFKTVLPKTAPQIYGPHIPTTSKMKEKGITTRTLTSNRSHICKAVAASSSHSPVYGDGQIPNAIGT